jgi:hypothetical protein
MNSCGFLLRLLSFLLRLTTPGFFSSREREQKNRSPPQMRRGVFTYTFLGPAIKTVNCQLSTVHCSLNYSRQLQASLLQFPCFNILNDRVMGYDHGNFIFLPPFVFFYFPER